MKFAAASSVSSGSDETMEDRGRLFRFDFVIVLIKDIEKGCFLMF